MNRSESINELATALAKAQGEIKNAPKDVNNPFFKSKYADLAGIVDACRAPLAKYGLAVIQGPITAYDASGVPIGHMIQLETILVHSSGQWISSVIGMTPSKFDCQGLVAAYTYARRASLAAIVGVAPEDDDGNIASGKTDKPNGIPVAPPAGIPREKLEAELMEFMRLPCWNEEQRDAAGEFLAGNPNYGDLKIKHSQAKSYVEKSFEKEQEDREELKIKATKTLKSINAVIDSKKGKKVEQKPLIDNFAPDRPEFNHRDD